MSGETRTYTKKARADAEAATRLKITQSAMELHGSVGPAQTSISAIADHAGVRRSTVYRHFPDEYALFEACSAHWLSLNPRPDLSAIMSLRDPHERLRRTLETMYGYFRRSEPMLANLLRDEATVPAVRERMQQFRAFFASLREPLLAGRGLRGKAKRRAEAAVGHALAFATWRSLARDEGLSDAEAAALMTALVDAAR